MNHVREAMDENGEFLAGNAYRIRLDRVSEARHDPSRSLHKKQAFIRRAQHGE